MNGNEAFKQYREISGYSIRHLAAVADVSPRVISYYENGEKQITSMTCVKACLFFDLFQAEVVPFFDTYFPYKSELDVRMEQWQLDNPRELRFDVLKKRIYRRLAKIKERGRVAYGHMVELHGQYRETFEYLSHRTDKEGKISGQDYTDYIIPLLCRIKREMQEEPENEISKVIWDYMMNSEYSNAEIASFCGVSGVHLKCCFNGTNDMSKMHIDTALKICYVLDIDFEKELRPVLRSFSGCGEI
jgi:DNA-binding XRE family transcriptional regulator